jgi:glycosyltransferase involved in cell wall biosynthesis
MKILNAIHAQGIGGVNQVFCNYTEVLTKNYHQVALLISDNGYNNYKAQKIFKLKNSSQICDFLKLYWILLTFRPDIIFCHSARLMKWMKILKWFCGVKSVAVNHGISFKSSLHCDYVISINQQISDLVTAAAFQKTRSFVLPNVINIDRQYQKKNLQNPPVIGIYGRIEPRKGFDILIAACGLLAKKGYDFRLKIGGFEVPGSYKTDTLKELVKTQNIAAKCSFVGTVTDKKSFFTDVDIFCVPSLEEPFGLVILEGFLFSTLVISSDSDGGKFLINNAEDGLLFKNGDAASLAEKIIFALNNPLIFNSITTKAFSKLAKGFSFDFMGQEISKILQKISSDHDV